MKINIIAIFICCSLILILNPSYSQAVYNYTNSFEYCIINPNQVLYNQYNADEYVWFPQNDNRTDSKFGLNSSVFLNSGNLSLNLTPEYKTGNFSFSLNIPYNFIMWDAMKNFGDILFKTGYTINKNNLSNSTSLGFSAPLGQFDQAKVYGYINGSGTWDLHLSNHLQLSYEKYGFYSTLFFRQALIQGDQTLIFITENEDYSYELNYKFRNGFVGATSFNTYFEPTNNFSIHFGAGIIYNHYNKFTKTTIESTDYIPHVVEVTEGDQQFLFYDFRLGFSYVKSKFSFSIFFLNPIDSNFHTAGAYNIDPVIKINYRFL